MTERQLTKLIWLSEKHPNSTWHYAHCGCCVCFHPNAETDHGYIIGRDGKAEYHGK